MALVTGRKTATMSSEDCDKELRRCALMMRSGTPEQRSKARRRADQLLDIRNDVKRAGFA